MGGRVLDFHLLCAYIGHHKNPTTAVMTQDVQRFNTKQHIATRTMQLMTIPPKIAVKMDDTDQLNHRGLSPTLLYDTHRPVVKLVYELDTNIVFRLAISITNVISTVHISIVDTPLGTIHQEQYPPCP